MDEKTKSVLKIVRSDLCFAMSVLEDEIEPSGAKIYNRRLQHGVKMITELLKDHEDFKQLQENWSKNE